MPAIFAFPLPFISHLPLSTYRVWLIVYQLCATGTIVSITMRPLAMKHESSSAMMKDILSQERENREEE